MEVMKKYHISRIIVIALVILSLVAYSCYTAPKAQAEAVTLSLTTAFLMLAIAVMATLGVTLTAPTNETAIDYIDDPFLSFLQGKGFSSISDYLLSVGVTSITQLCVPVFGAVNIVKSVYDIIAEFCTSFFADEGVQSGGASVGELPVSSVAGTPRYGYQAQPLSFSSSGGTITLNNQNVYAYGDYYQGAYSRVDGGFNSVTISSLTQGRYYYTDSSYWDYSSYLLLFVNEPSDISYYTYSTSATREIIRLSGYSYPHTFNLSRTYNYIAYCIRPWDARGTSSGTLNIYSPFSITSTFSFQKDAGFVIAPSATVLSPPSVATGQSYSIPSSNTRADDDPEQAINDVIAPLTSTGGLSKTASVSGTAVPAEWAWLYEGVESIKNNTSDDRHGTDFIPSSTTMDLGFWHYVPDWISSVGAGFSLLVGVVTSLPPIMLAPLYGILVLGIVVALFHKLWGS